MAALLDLSLSGYANYEAGVRVPGADTLNALGDLAEEHELLKLAGHFNVAAAKKINASVGPATKEEQAWTNAILFLVRNDALRYNVTDPIVFMLNELRTSDMDVQPIGDHSIDEIALELKVLTCHTTQEKLNALVEARIEQGEQPGQAYARVLHENPALAARLARETEKTEKKRTKKEATR